VYSKPISVQSHENYTISILFDNGTVGIIDLSHLVGKGIFVYWNNYDNFRNVYINKETKAIS
jgi:hypothetical protein